MSKPGRCECLGMNQEQPVYCLDGIRYAGDVTHTGALIRNSGTCRQANDKNVWYRGGLIRISVKVLVMSME